MQFTLEMKMVAKKDEFLSTYILCIYILYNHLASYLTAKGPKTFKATGDADCLIVQPAVALAMTSNVILVGDDTVAHLVTSTNCILFTQHILIK